MEPLLPPAMWKTLRNRASETLGDDFWSDIAALLPREMPRMDVYVRGDDIVVVAELPGLADPGRLQIGLAGRMLTIRGELTYDYPVSPEGLFLSERWLGPFERTVELPAEAAPDPVRAKYGGGLLTVRLARVPEPAQLAIVPEFEHE